MHQDSKIVRRVSKQIMVGAVPVGGDAPIAVQSMTNTNTLDVAATVAQIRRLEVAGADIVRVSVPSMYAAEAFGKIRAQVDVPLVSDIHFDYKIALKVAASHTHHALDGGFHFCCLLRKFVLVNESFGPCSHGRSARCTAPSTTGISSRIG